jgi:hypothetical protein
VASPQIDLRGSFQRQASALWVVRCFIEATLCDTLEHSQAPGAYVPACALLPTRSPLFQRKYQAHTPLPTLYTWGKTC